MLSFTLSLEISEIRVHSHFQVILRSSHLEGSCDLKSFNFVCSNPKGLKICFVSLLSLMVTKISNFINFSTKILRVLWCKMIFFILIFNLKTDISQSENCYKSASFKRRTNLIEPVEVTQKSIIYFKFPLLTGEKLEKLF